MENKVRIVPMNGDHLDQVAELERICFSVWKTAEILCVLSVIPI